MAEIARAAALLDPVMPMMTAIGGSDAQDDLFRQTYLRSLQAAGRRADAAAYFQAITADHGARPRAGELTAKVEACAALRR